jgi:hypothetical protein
MKTLVLVAATILLCSCAEYGPPTRTSMSFNGQSVRSMDLTRLSKNLFRVNHAFHHSCSIWLCPHRIA